MAPFHQCPWENCTYTREEVPIGNVSSPEDNFKLCESKDMTDSSIFPSPSQEGCSDVLSIPETGTSTAEDTSMKATSTTASSQSQSEKKKKPNILCIPDNSRHAWKYFNKKGQICDLCANVLPNLRSTFDDGTLLIEA
ncbi:hypothetical protein LX32DRAFT_652742 [Colletotrichum zoysiae]|uniref:Uncharacterized protein n=1 Tax=Colletotrichum zoysiae TaxID=1216348 RepID=A0AAD9M1V2_9PEZI|nr:hypothetical protein LX32DRAFT_652742 [Colletotrichum zoysiae]